MKPLKTMCVVLALAMLGWTARPLIAGARAEPVPAAVPVVADATGYAEREAAAPSAATFDGGAHDLIAFIIVVALLVWAVDFLLHGPYCGSCGVYHHH